MSAKLAGIFFEWFSTKTVFLNVDQKQKMASTDGPSVKMPLFLGTTNLSLNST